MRVFIVDSGRDASIELRQRDQIIHKTKAEEKENLEKRVATSLGSHHGSLCRSCTWERKRRPSQFHFRDSEAMTNSLVGLGFPVITPLFN